MRPSQSLLDALARTLGQPPPLAMEPVAGGCVHAAWRIRGPRCDHFIKTAATPSAIASLVAEADGLRRLAALPNIAVPAVIALLQVDTEAALVLPWIDVDPTAALGEAVGHAVAALHACAAPTWGMDADNRIALLEQPNTPLVDGDTFWAERRLRAGVALACNRDALRSRDIDDITRLAEVLERGIPGSRPLDPVWLHGDLWSGNVVVDRSGRPWLIDPAVYGGDPRVDLAMANLFGGFTPAFGRAWREAHGVRPDDGLRDRLYRLWPLLVHAALFGGGYGAEAGQVARGLLAEVGA